MKSEPHSPQPLAFHDLKCPACGYALAGLSQPTCPECGQRFDPLTLPHLPCRERRMRWLVSLAIMAFMMYAPFSWLLLIDYPFDTNHWLWIRL